MILTPAPAGALPASEITVVINRVYQLENPDAGPFQDGQADFYARVSINGRTQSNRDQALTGADISPGWTFTESIGNPDLERVGISIEIWDADDDGSLPDDIIDIDRRDGDQAIDLFVDRKRWRLDPGTSDVTFPHLTDIAGDGDTEHTGLTEGGEAGGVWIDVLIGNTSLSGRDRDGDGLFDSWETQGVDFDGDGTPEVDLPAMGADPDHKDIFVEFDWLAGEEPTWDLISEVKAAFDRAPVDAGGITNPDDQPGINVWIDTGPLRDDAGRLVGDNLGGGNEIISEFIASLDESFSLLKEDNFDDLRRGIFHYAVSVGDRFEDPADEASCSDGLDNNGDGRIDLDDPVCRFNGGQGELHGDDFIERNHTPGTFMHELGHNLGLRHGGREDGNCKPNYISLMNYHHGVFGIPQRGGGFLMDFSPAIAFDRRAEAPAPRLNEAALSEIEAVDLSNPTAMVVFTNGEGRYVQSPANNVIDWDGDGRIEADDTVSANINDADPESGFPGDCANDSDTEVLDGYDDWRNIELDFKATNATTTDSPTDAAVEDLHITEAELMMDQLNTTDLGLGVKAVSDSVAPGETVEITVSLTNNGHNPANETSLAVDVPKGLTTVHLDGCDEFNGSICSISDVQAREQRTVALALSLPSEYPADGEVIASYNVSHAGTDLDHTDNTAEVQIPVRFDATPGLHRPSEDLPDNMTVGTTYDVTVGFTASNRGPSTASIQVVTAFEPAATGLRLEPESHVAKPAAASITFEQLPGGQMTSASEAFEIVCLAAGTWTVGFDLTATALDADGAVLGRADSEINRQVHCVSGDPGAPPDELPGEDPPPPPVVPTTPNRGR